jgi:hypothetical protein
MEEENDIEDFRLVLSESVSIARGMVDKINEKARRIKEAEEILRSISLN